MVFTFYGIPAAEWYVLPLVYLRSAPDQHMSDTTNAFRFTGVLKGTKVL